jgi:Putative beta-barrel porin-2, OmpL-like. bbp2
MQTKTTINPKTFLKGLVAFSTGLVFSLPAAHAELKRLPSKKSQPASVQVVVPYAPLAPASQATEVSSTGIPFKWDAYMDVKMSIPSKDTALDRGFTLNDAALYLNKDFGRQIRGQIELPFTGDSSGKTSAFAFANDRSQAYIEVDRWSPVFFKVGQYNSYFGHEANDSRGRFFADLGAIKGLILPKTHTGLQAGYQNSKVAFAGQIVDPSGTNTMTGGNPEIGLNGRMDTGSFFGSLGFSWNESKTSPTADKTNLIFDVVGGVESEKLQVNGELDITRSAGSDKTGFAIGTFGKFNITEDAAVGARLEYLKNVSAPATFAPAGIYDSIWALGVGASYRLQQDLLVRGDISYAAFKDSTFDDSILGLTASMVASF